MREVVWSAGRLVKRRAASALPLRPAPARQTTRPAATRRAFTLYEMLLVLVILGLLAGFTWPMATWWMRDQGLRQAAADVRVVLDRTRVHAVDHGLMYAFYFEPNGRHFLAVPAEIPLDAPPANTSASGSAGQAGGPGMNGPAAGADDDGTTTRIEYLFGVLPEGVVFSQVVPLANPPGKLNPRMYELLVDARDIEDVPVWSQPLIYRTNGSSDDHVLEILTEDARHAITLELRGLTGTLRTSDVHLEGRG